MIRESLYLADGVEYIIVETDEDEPTLIATIDKTVTPEQGYRIRVKFGKKAKPCTNASKE